MFNFPEPRAVEFILTDVRPSYLSDGIFFHGSKPGPTHKCVAKQLSPVKRKPNDPVPPIAKLESRVLERLASRGKAFYADTRSRGVDARDLHNVLHHFRNIDKKYVATERRSAVIFPRSLRYEYDYGKKKIRQNDDLERLKCPRRCSGEFNASAKWKLTKEITRSESDKPFWWNPRPAGKYSHPFSAGSPNNCSIGYLHHPTKRARKEDNEVDKDSRWRPLYGITDLPKTEEERRKGMSELLKSYLHELDKWYSVNTSTSKR